MKVKYYEILEILYEIGDAASLIDNYGYQEDINYNLKRIEYQFSLGEYPVPKNLAKKLPDDFWSTEINTLRDFVYKHDCVEIKEPLEKLVTFLKDHGCEIDDYWYDLENKPKSWNNC